MKEIWYVHKAKIAGGVIAVVAVLAIVIWPSVQPASSENPSLEQISFQLKEEEKDEMPVAEASVQDLTHTTEEILIDIKGAVEVPGVYKMKVGDRIIDAVEKAGGFSEQANTRRVNLAALLADEMVIVVPMDGEEEEPVIVVAPQASSSGNEESGATININTATEEELTKLTGVGPAKAKAIIDYRTEHGLFKKIEDITNVTGIGEKSFEKIKNDISVGN